MGIIGQIVARRVQARRADALMHQRSPQSLSVPARRAEYQRTTAAGANAYSFRGAGLLPGLESRNGSPDFSTQGFSFGDTEPGLRVIPAADIKRRARLIDEGQLSPSPEDGPLTRAGEALRSLRESAADDARLFGFVEAADFAGKVEEISRSLEYLQLVAAQAVERTRKEAQLSGPGSSAAAPEWRTGWTEPEPEPGPHPASACPAEARSTVAAPPMGDAGSGSTAGSKADAALKADEGFMVGAGFVANAGLMANAGFVADEGFMVGAGSGALGAGSTASPLDDGYPNAAEFLRARLRIGIGEARRRLTLAAEILPQAGMAGQEIPARRQVLAEAVGAALVPSRAATII
ncbi:hypothetical protein ACLRGI_06135, partial [Paenarthrobacter nitroguajacolicus]